MTRDERVWLGWLVFVACSFGALETSLDAKLCASLRRWLRIHPQRPGHRIAGMVIILGLAWFVAHLLDEDHR